MSQKAHQPNQLLMYRTEDGDTRIDVLYEDETVWLTQAQMSELFQKSAPTINEHIKNIYDEGELDRPSTTRKFRIVQMEGTRRVTRDIDHYNLNVIISVGYRVKSQRGTQFRIWASKQLTELIRKGFVMDDDRLSRGGSNYFEELEERVRRIRLSEVNFYKKVRSVFATSIDYDKDSVVAHTFYATVQNKFHYAIHGHTAAELIMERIDPEKKNLGLTTWQKAKVFTLQDAFIAKNYLTELEIKRLGLLVEQFLSYAQLQTVERNPMTMEKWSRKLDEFITTLNEKPLLPNAGSISNAAMEAHVRKEYEAYRGRIIAEQALSDAQWEEQLLDAAEQMLLPAPDDLETQGISNEYYNLKLMNLNSRMEIKSDNPEEEDDEIDFDNGQYLDANN